MSKSLDLWKRFAVNEVRGFNVKYFDGALPSIDIDFVNPKAVRSLTDTVTHADGSMTIRVRPSIINQTHKVTRQISKYGLIPFLSDVLLHECLHVLACLNGECSRHQSLFVSKANYVLEHLTMMNLRKVTYRNGHLFPYGYRINSYFKGGELDL